MNYYFMDKTYDNYTVHTKFVKLLQKLSEFHSLWVSPILVRLQKESNHSPIYSWSTWVIYV